MKLYISGPMQGVPDDNRAAFADAADYYRNLGNVVFNPADREANDRVFILCANRDELDLLLRAGILSQPQRRIWMRDDIFALSQCDGIVLLEGWEKSRGALAEAAWMDSVGGHVFYDKKVRSGEQIPPIAGIPYPLHKRRPLRR